MTAGARPGLSRAAFAGGDFAFNLFWQGTALFLMYFYTDVLGLAPVLAGTIYLIAMLWDGVTDPVMGAIADRTRTRFGRFRPYILFGAAPLAISYPLAFSAPELSGNGLFWWALATQVWLRTCYTIVAIPFSSMQARITQDTHERTAFAGARMIGGALGGLTIAFATPTIVQSYGGDEASGYFAAGCVAGGLAFVFLLFSFAILREPEDRTPPAEWRGVASEALTFIDILRANPPLRQVFVMIVTSSVAVAMFGKCLIYFFKYDLQQPQHLTTALVTQALAALAAAPLWVMVARRASKRTTLLSGAALAGAAYVALFAAPAPTLPFVLVLIACSGVGAMALGVAFWSMLPDTVEYGEALTGERHEARVVGFATFAQKAALGVNALLLGVTLQWSGFVADAVQSEETVRAIRAVMTLAPLAGVLIIAAVMRTYPINERYHAELKARIAAGAGR